MGLLTPQDNLDIRSAIKQVTDTFYVTPLVYHQKTLNYTRFGTGDDLFTEYNLLCIVEYPKPVQNVATFTGIAKAQGQAILDWDCKLTLLVDDIMVAYSTLFVNDNFVGTTDDQVAVKGERFNVVHTALDGPLETKNVLLEIYLRKLEK